MNEYWMIAGGVLGVVLLYFGAELLIGGGVALARICGVPKLVIGLTLVAFGTSAPELVVSVDAAIRASGDIAVGNVVGSNICNIVLILGISALISELSCQRSLLLLDLPFLGGVSLLFVLLCLFGKGWIGRLDGGILLAIFCIYIFVRFKYFSFGLQESVESDKKLSVFAAIVFTILGLAGLVGGAKLFVGGAVTLAKIAGLSEALVALTVVSLGTSLPELATSAVAAWKGETDIAVGNVVGSNLFNILLIMSVTPLIRPINIVGIGMVDLLLMLGVTLLLYGIMLLARRLRRIDGALLLAIYVAYIIFLVRRG